MTPGTAVTTIDSIANEAASVALPRTDDKGDPIQMIWGLPAHGDRATLEPATCEGIETVWSREAAAGVSS
jgi:hypothetical protein